jgi:hypothetical protein
MNTLFYNYRPQRGASIIKLTGYPALPPSPVEFLRRGPHRLLCSGPRAPLGINDGHAHIAICKVAV